MNLVKVGLLYIKSKIIFCPCFMDFHLIWGGGVIEEMPTKMYQMIVSFVKIGAVNYTYLGT